MGVVNDIVAFAFIILLDAHHVVYLCTVYLGVPAQIRCVNCAPCKFHVAPHGHPIMLYVSSIISDSVFVWLGSWQ